MKSNIRIIILAAGDGKRMKSDIPKVLHTLEGKTFIERVVSAAEKVDCGKPIVVVSAKHKLVQNALVDRAVYAVQAQQRGTGHAVLCAEQIVEDAVHVVVLYGDHPRMSAESIVRLIHEHTEKGNTMTFALSTVPNFDGPYAAFRTFSRIVRDERGNIIRDVQYADATEAELCITEINPGVYCFCASWLWKNLAKLTPHNVQNELYLSDLVQQALTQKEPVSSIALPLVEALGINSQDDLRLAEILTL